MDRTCAEGLQTWLAAFREPTELLGFWYSVYLKLGASWPGLCQRLAHPPCRLFARGNGYAAVVEQPTDTVCPGLGELLAYFGAAGIAQPPDGLEPADLSGCLMRLKLKECGPPTGISPFAVFAVDEGRDVNGFVHWLMRLPHEDARFAVCEVDGRPATWLIGVQHLRSWTPFQSEFRDRRLPGVRVFVPVDERSCLTHPEGFYVEVGHRPWCGVEAFRDLWAHCGGAHRGHLVLRGERVLTDAGEVRFSPIPDVADLVLDPGLTHVALRPAAARGRLGRFELRIEPVDFPDRVHPRVEWRRVKDKIDFLKARLEELEIQDSEDAPEPLVLLRIPQPAEPALHEMLRRTPEDVLKDFVYFSRYCDGERSHFIYPSATAAHRTFPAVAGAERLFCGDDWRRAGLRLFMSSDLRLAPHVHFSQASKIRQALLNGTSPDGLGRSPLFLFWRDTQRRVREYILPDPGVGFVPLLHALEYSNGCVLADVRTKPIEHTVAAFCEAGLERLEQADGELQSGERIFLDAADRFVVEATSKLNQDLSRLKELEADVDALATRIQRAKDAVREIDVLINSHVMPRNQVQWQKIRDELASLQAAIGRLLGPKGGGP